MKIKNIQVHQTIAEAEKLLSEEKNISPALRAIFKLILVLMNTLLGRFNLNSKNSSKPPSSDPNREKSKKEKSTSARKPGGQPGRIGKQLKPVNTPDEVKILTVDRRTLPRGRYQEEGFEARQVIDFVISIHVIEYRAQILIGSQGERYVAEFPDFVTRPVQYGVKTKATAVYMSQYQLIPYQRIEHYFSEQIGLPLSVGALFNFNQEAYALLERFETIAKEKLIGSETIHADETGINIDGKRFWLHTACNDLWTHLYPHTKRGHEAMDEIGILPQFKGNLCHDHWKAYYRYGCRHVLCNAHHLRELKWAETEEKQKWALIMRKFLIRLNEKVKASGGVLSPEKSRRYRSRYHRILRCGEKECPLPERGREKGTRGRIKKSKSRNLLERLREYEEDVLRFVEDKHAPFTNNQGENDLRMTKVQQKISGCFRSLEGALIFCRIRSYLITCRKHDVSATEALETLFKGNLPGFVNSG
ncbi:MAG: IS66 family transposase [Bacteroidia bacterium]